MGSRYEQFKDTHIDQSRRRSVATCLCTLLLVACFCMFMVLSVTEESQFGGGPPENEMVVTYNEPDAAQCALLGGRAPSFSEELQPRTVPARCGNIAAHSAADSNLDQGDSADTAQSVILLRPYRVWLNESWAANVNYILVEYGKIVRIEKAGDGTGGLQNETATIQRVQTEADVDTLIVVDMEGRGWVTPLFADSLVPAFELSVYDDIAESVSSTSSGTTKKKRQVSGDGGGGDDDDDDDDSGANVNAYAGADDELMRTFGSWRSTLERGASQVFSAHHSAVTRVQRLQQRSEPSSFSTSTLVNALEDDAQQSGRGGSAAYSSQYLSRPYGVSTSTHAVRANETFVQVTLRSSLAAEYLLRDWRAARDLNDQRDAWCRVVRSRSANHTVYDAACDGSMPDYRGLGGLADVIGGHAWIHLDVMPPMLGKRIETALHRALSEWQPRHWYSLSNDESAWKTAAKTKGKSVRVPDADAHLCECSAAWLYGFVSALSSDTSDLYTGDLGHDIVDQASARWSCCKQYTNDTAQLYAQLMKLLCTDLSLDSTASQHVRSISINSEAALAVWNQEPVATHYGQRPWLTVQPPNANVLRRGAAAPPGPPLGSGGAAAPPGPPLGSSTVSSTPVSSRAGGLGGRQPPSLTVYHHGSHKPNEAVGCTDGVDAASAHVLEGVDLMLPAQVQWSDAQTHEAFASLDSGSLDDSFLEELPRPQEIDETRALFRNCTLGVLKGSLVCAQCWPRALPASVGSATCAWRDDARFAEAWVFRPDPLLSVAAAAGATRLLVAPSTVALVQTHEERPSSATSLLKADWGVGVAVHTPSLLRQVSMGGGFARVEQLDASETATPVDLADNGCVFVSGARGIEQLRRALLSDPALSSTSNDTLKSANSIEKRLQTGQLGLCVRANTATEIRNACAVTNLYQYKSLTIVGGEEAYAAADAIVAINAQLIFTPPRCMHRSPVARCNSTKNARLFALLGIPFGIALDDSPDPFTRLRLEAGALARDAGLGLVRAWSTLNTNVARALRLPMSRSAGGGQIQVGATFNAFVYRYTHTEGGGGLDGLGADAYVVASLQEDAVTC